MISYATYRTKKDAALLVSVNVLLWMMLVIGFPYAHVYASVMLALLSLRYILSRYLHDLRDVEEMELRDD